MANHNQYEKSKFPCPKCESIMIKMDIQVDSGSGSGSVSSTVYEGDYIQSAGDVYQCQKCGTKLLIPPSSPV